MSSEYGLCRNGHLLTDESSRARNDGGRRCLTCKRAMDAAYRQRAPRLLASKELPSHCSNGHELTADSVRLYGNERRCRVCIQNVKFKARMRQYGLTEDQYIEFMEAQEYRCPICHTDFELLGQEPAIDHDHSTGAVRGLLCSKCNLGLGNLRDDVEMLRSAIHYLVSHSLLD